MRSARRSIFLADSVEFTWQVTAVTQPTRATSPLTLRGGWTIQDCFPVDETGPSLLAEPMIYEAFGSHSPSAVNPEVPTLAPLPLIRVDADQTDAFQILRQEPALWTLSARASWGSRLAVIDIVQVTVQHLVALSTDGFSDFRAAPKYEHLPGAERATFPLLAVRHLTVPQLPQAFPIHTHDIQADEPEFLYEHPGNVGLTLGFIATINHELAADFWLYLAHLRIVHSIQGTPVCYTAQELALDTEHAPPSPRTMFGQPGALSKYLLGGHTKLRLCTPALCGFFSFAWAQKFACPWLSPDQFVGSVAMALRLSATSSTLQTMQIALNSYGADLIRMDPGAGSLPPLPDPLREATSVTGRALTQEFLLLLAQLRHLKARILPNAPVGAWSEQVRKLRRSYVFRAVQCLTDCPSIKSIAISGNTIAVAPAHSEAQLHEILAPAYIYNPPELVPTMALAPLQLCRVLFPCTVGTFAPEYADPNPELHAINMAALATTWELVEPS